MGDVVQIDDGLVRLAGHQRLGLFVAVAVGQVQKADRHAGRAAVRGHVVQPHRRPAPAACRERNRGAAAARRGFRAAPSAVGSEDQRAAVILALVAGPFGLLAVAADLAAPRPTQSGEQMLAVSSARVSCGRDGRRS